MSEPPIEPSSPITVGHVISLHGVSGTVKARVLSDVADRFDAGRTLYVHSTPYSIESSARIPKGQVVLKFHGVDSPAAAQCLVGADITVPEASVPSLPDGEYFHFQLLGLRVFTDEGEYLGELNDILETGSNDVYVVSKGTGELLIPALAEVVREVHVSDRRMVVRLPPGLR